MPSNEQKVRMELTQKQWDLLEAIQQDPFLDGFLEGFGLGLKAGKKSAVEVAPYRSMLCHGCEGYTETRGALCQECAKRRNETRDKEIIAAMDAEVDAQSKPSEPKRGDAAFLSVSNVLRKDNGVVCSQEKLARNIIVALGLDKPTPEKLKPIDARELADFIVGKTWHTADGLADLIVSRYGVPERKPIFVNNRIAAKIAYRSAELNISEQDYNACLCKAVNEVLGLEQSA
jgi:hypothetical protein